jgi:signal transduction histidine kinase/DNA-binding response OmpR family regulator
MASVTPVTFVQGKSNSASEEKGMRGLKLFSGVADTVIEAADISLEDCNSYVTKRCLSFYPSILEKKVGKLDTLGRQIGFGFAIPSCILLCAVVLTIWQVNDIARLSERIESFRSPVMQAGLSMLTGLTQSVASLRSWALSAEDKFREERKKGWQLIDRSLADLTRLSGRWATEPQDMGRLNQIKAKLERLRFVQSEVERLGEDRTRVEQAKAFLDSLAAPEADEIIRLLEDMVQRQKELMRKDIVDSKQRVAALQKLEWILLVTGLSLAVIFGLVIVRGITGPIVQTVQVADRIAKEDFGFEISIKGPREIKGLSASLEEMRRNLSTRSWLIASQLELLEVMVGEQRVGELVQRILAYIAGKIQAQLGSFYLVDGDALNPVEGYAQHGTTFKGRSFSIGEGLIGQAVRQKDLLVVTDVPGEYFTIHSSLGEMRPKNLLIVPILSADQAVGVIEFASKDVFTDMHLEFIQQVSQNIGIAVNLSLSNEQTRQLLGEIQAQAEELQQTNEELAQKSQELIAQQAELQQSNEELEAQRAALEEERDKLEMLTTELEASQRSVEEKAKEAQESSRYKSEFLANMSHELRTPLNSIMILSQLTAENQEGNLTDSQIQNVRTIYSSSQSLLSLINDILDLSKVEAGKLDIIVSQLSVHEMVDNLRRTFSPQMQAKDLAFAIEVDPGVPQSMLSDQIRVEQILRNLISNAMKFTEQGAVRVTFKQAHETDNAPLGFEVTSAIAIAVEDTGIGIPNDKKELIFEAFQQVDSSLSRKYGGTGLGLAISQNLAKKLGGYITLKTEMGKGSTFTLFLPRTLDEFAEPDAPRQDCSISATAVETSHAQAELPSGIHDDRKQIGDQDRIILIIEDDERFAKVLIDICHRSGFKCLYARNGEQGWQDVNTFMPYAVILDLRLPGVNGVALLDTLKSDPKTRHIPVHVMSVDNRKAEVMRLGAMGFSEKPISKEELERAITEIEKMSSREAKNILLVEDDPIACDSITQLIGGVDVKIKSAATSKQALALLQEHHYDCLILDITLKDGDGYEVLNAFDNNTTLRELPVIIYTGKELSGKEHQRLQQYSQSIIIKGAVSPERLLDEVTLFLHHIEKNLPKEERIEPDQSRPQEDIFAGKKLLIVDDDIRNIYALRQVLLMQGFAISQASNGKEALALLNEHPDMDIVLMDIMMPEMNGIEAIRELRQDQRFQNLPVIALTAKAAKKDREECLAIGANDYLAKPVNMYQLLSLLRIWLSVL